MMRNVVLLLCVGCASTTSTTRELPTGMSTMGSLLDGCQSEADEGVARMRCPDGIAVAARTRTVGVAEAMYRAEAYSMAQLAGGRLVWDQLSVETEGPSGLVDRARALVPGTDVPNATLVGVVRSVGSNEVEEIWCTSTDAAGALRCNDLLGVVLAGPTERAPAKAAEVPKDGHVTIFGRSLSLPTSCTAKALPNGGDATCSDGATLSWRRFDRMDEATETVRATLQALGDSEGEAYACTIAGEAGQCEEHPHAAAGLAYVDGKAVAAMCVGVEGPRSHSLCKALMTPAR